MTLRNKLSRRMEERAASGAYTGGIEMLKEWEIEHVSGAEWVVTHTRFTQTDNHYSWVATMEWREVSGE